jgi:multidrug transporter EmrE-like cation transporter
MGTTLFSNSTFWKFDFKIISGLKMTKGFILLSIAILFNGIANILIKKGMLNQPEAASTTQIITHYCSSWPVIAGLIMFTINIVAYTQALSRLPLSVAYPIMVAMSGLIVIMGSIILFKETINWSQWIGFALIITGITMVAK